MQLRILSLGLDMSEQKVSSTKPASFSMHRTLDICVPPPQLLEHESNSENCQENSGFLLVFRSETVYSHFIPRFSL